MKLICLNLWGGKINDKMNEYLKKESKSTDIFCFQEVFRRVSGNKEGSGWRANLYAELEILLDGFEGSFARMISGAGFKETAPGVDFGTAIFIKKDFGAKKTGSEILVKKPTPKSIEIHSKVSSILQWAQIRDLSVFNFHGLAAPKEKLDTPDRIEQSRKAKKIMDSFPGRKILVGDFNLMPEPESMKILEKGMRNLITESGITSTRTEFCQLPNKYSDYVLVSPDIKVKKFEVQNLVVSDHLPLVLEFE